MKQEWSSSWKSSTQARKKRKYVHNIPTHLARRLVTALLRKDLRARYAKRNIKLRKGDSVKIMRGQYKGRIGKIDGLNVKKGKVYIDSLTVTKKDGNKVQVPVHASNLMVTEIFTEDRKRMKKFEKSKTSVSKKVEKRPKVVKEKKK